jgi:cytochrome c oxidase subunit 3
VEGEYPLMYVALMTFILIISSVTMVLAVEAGHRNDKRGVINWLAATVVGGLIFLGSQAWEWSHFIHGSGGAFLTAQEVTVNDESGNAIVVPAGTPVYMDHHFGDMAEKWLEGSHDVSLSEHNGTVHFTENGAHGSHEAALHEVRINKYVENETKILDAEATKLWNARSPNFTFGANLHDSEYAVQQTYSNFFFFITGFHGFHVFSGVVINLIVLLMAINGVFERRKHYEMVEKVGLYWHFVDLVWVFVFTFFYLI